MQPGIVRKQSRYSVEESVARLLTLLAEKGIKLFALWTTPARQPSPA